MSTYSEDTLIEQPAIALFRELGWETVGCFNEAFGASGTLGRETKAEVVLVPRLRAALERLNPGLPAERIGQAVEALTRDRSALGRVHANQEVYRLLKDGVKVRVRTGRGGQEEVRTARVVDWTRPEANDFLLASQFRVTGPMHERRADLVGFVNGVPLLLVELKATHKRLQDAYDDNLRDYRETIPHLFWFTGLIVLSNGSESRVGSTSASWEHFNAWKQIDSAGSQGVVSLETVIRGTCEKARLLDLVENFTLFSTAEGGLRKILAKNHQFLGVSDAVAAMARARSGKDSGRLGVFWHTQGSGKSLSMVFFSQKVLRKTPGNHTFLLVTDREELDDQLYKTFKDAGAVTEEHLRATSGEHLRRLLREDHRQVFTLIQKFRTPDGEPFPVLSERSDIVVMTDEAHRSQYDTFAMNMRRALPNAAFIGFTGTPLMGDDERTRQVFGEYVSIYNFRQSVEDGATVPLYYENRIPELELTNEGLNEDLADLIEQAGLDEAQERKLEREFAREYQLITRDDRLEAIAQDIVRHFMGRGQAGKAMVVSIDKATAVKMYDKVRAHWDADLARRRAELPGLSGEARAEAERQIAFMAETDLAVVVSDAQNEEADFAKRGLDIRPHRRRMVTEDLETKFKDPDDPFRIVFVTAMWITGFDVPSLSTVYLDKPMRNHTLMQTIARANRVFAGKLNGLIVDYVGVFRDLQRALAIYGSAAGGGVGAGEMPVKPKAELVAALRGAVAETTGFLTERGVSVEALLGAEGFNLVRLLDDAVEAILGSEESKKRFLALANGVKLGYRAILPDPAAEEFRRERALFEEIAAKIRALAPVPSIDAVMEEVGKLLDASIATEGYVIREPGAGYDAHGIVDLSRLDVEALRKAFAAGKRHTETERLTGAIERTLQWLVEQNRTRTDYLQRFQDLIDEYNAGSRNVQLHFEELVKFAEELTAEERRGIAEQLTEEELAISDLLTRPDPGLSPKETATVKQAARDLLATLKREKLVLDWRSRQQTRAELQRAIELLLDETLPATYATEDYRRRCDAVYQHVYDAYYGQGQSVYGVVVPEAGAFRYRCASG